MRAETYLERVKKIDVLILCKMREYRRWVDTAEGMSGAAFGERVQSSRNLHRGADAIINYTVLDGEIKALEAERQNIIRTIERLPSEACDVLHMYYVGKYDKKLDRMQYSTLKDIAFKYKISYDGAKKKKQRAVRLLGAVLDEQGI
jgi:hypothetical protein